jgi:hypothetical protein
VAHNKLLDSCGFIISHVNLANKNKSPC